MGVAFKKIEKVKSLNKRLEAYDEVFSLIESDESQQIASLLLEKAKYGEDFVQVLSAIGRLTLPNKKDVILEIAKKCNQDPDQSGKAMVIMSNLGYKDELIAYWQVMQDFVDYSHPNLKARMLVWGTVFSETKNDAESKLKQLLSAVPDIPEICYQTPSLDGIWYMTNWKL